MVDSATERQTPSCKPAASRVVRVFSNPASRVARWWSPSGA